MTPQELKNSILQLAIQGKLVEQRPEEGTGEELYQQIRIEKQELIKTGNIKKSKALLEIAEDEKPFLIPKSWKWVRLGDVLKDILVPQRDKPKSFNGSIPWCRIEDIEGKYLKRTKSGQYVSQDTVSRMNLKVNPVGTVISANSASVGAAAITTVECVTNQTFVGLVCMEGLYNEYLYYFLIANSATIRKLGTGTTILYVSQEKYRTLLMPLPPLDEQKRIVAKIEELLPLINRYEEVWTKLEEFNKRFPNDLQKSLLQMAIQGKLVEQRPEEGTGEELYQRIQAEKIQLIKEGKIKKEKPLPEISDDEKPFDIPESWKWVRLKEICSKIVDGDHNPPSGVNAETDYLMLSATNINHNCLCELDKVRYLTKDIFEIENERTKATEGDIFFTTVGTLGRSCVFDGQKSVCFQRSVSVLTTFVYNFYLKYVLDSSYIQNFMIANATGTAQKGFYLNQVERLVIPLPPLAEQKRIVSELEKLLPLCERLK